MSWGIDIETADTDGNEVLLEVVDGHTYNLNPMWRKAGVFESSRDLDGRTTADIAPVLSAALLDAVQNRSAYEELEPENGWGDYEGFLKILLRFTELAWSNPTGTLRWNG